MNISNLKERVSKKLDTQFYNILDKILIVLIFISVLIFILWPIMSVIKESFFKNGSFTLDLYKNIFMDNRKIIKNSLFISIVCTIITTILSTCISIYISFSNKKVKKVILIILMLTMISPPFVSSLSYITLFGRRGLITHKLLNLTLNTYGWQGIVIMESLSFIPLSTLIMIGIINGIDTRVIDASLDLGASISETIIKIVIPLMKPAIVVCALLVFVRSLSDFGTPMIIGGSFTVLATEVYTNVISNGNFKVAAVMSVLILIPALVAFIFYRIYMKDTNVFSKEKGQLFKEGSRYKLKGSMKFIFSFVTYLFVIIMLLQYTAIFIQAITKFKYGKIYLTLDNIKSMAEYSMGSFGRSIIYSLIVAVVGSFLGVIISYFVDRRKIIGMKYIDFIATLPYIVPGTFFGIGYILAFNKYPLELTGTSFIVIVNCIFKQLPMTTKMGSAVLTQVDQEIEQASKDLGASNIVVIKDIILPMLKPAFISGFINNFTATMTTIGSIIFLIYPGEKVATVEMFNSIQSGEYGVGAAMATFIIIITLTINILFSKRLLGGKNVFQS
ncbi:iron ABC transporter permease [Clostridium oceanicum]|uniref:Iron ABC transporter permease n=1 Tax=Clostridium oceanicum TaxID=1543 RepID=A0ABP3UM84_9CLOT